MASNDQPSYPQNSSYSQPQSSSSVFYENEVKKGSEIMLRDSEVQQLLQNREAQHSQQQQQQQQHNHHHQQQLQQHHLHQQHLQQQELLQQPVKSEPMSHSPERIAPVCSSTSETSPNHTDSPVVSSDDRNQLSQSHKTHMCMTCFKGFRNKPQLTQHELVHNNKRKHVCSYCEKSFKQICHLNQHIRVHTGDRPYKCDVEGCGRSFAQLSNLNHHKKNHDDTVKRDVSRQFRCHVCERSYATKSSLNTHVQKLHSNLKLDITSPILSSTTPAPRKRKKKGENNESLGRDPNTYMMECDSDDGLPTQVKVKPRFESKSNLTVRIGTPPGNGEKDHSRQTPRTTLPLPFSTNHSQSSPMSLRYQQSQGQDHFITTFSDSISHGQSHRDLLQSQHSQNLFPHIDSLSESSHSNHRNLHDNTQLLHVSSSNTDRSDGQNEEMKLITELSKSEALIAERRMQMQAAISHREALLSGRLKLNYDPINLQHPPATSNISQMQGISTDSRPSTDHLPAYGHPQGQATQSSIQSSVPYGCQQDRVSQASIQSEVPSHIAHHYPKTNSSEQSRVTSQQIFNPAFTETNSNTSIQSRYNQNQY